MSFQFHLNWLNTNVGSNANNQTTRASYRQKSVGGAWLTDGFTPDNPIAKSVTETLSKPLLDNVVYEFQVESLCGEGGPNPNSNGVVEAIHFACLVVTPQKTHNATTITLDVSGTDLTKAEFCLKKTSDNSIVSANTTYNRVGNSIGASASGLTSNTDYYWEVYIHATVGGVDTLGGAPCTYNLTTDPPLECIAVTNLTVS
jgi:hypothetical protein